jgi:hypothetical protein
MNNAENTKIKKKIKYDAYKKPAFNEYETAEKKQQKLNVTVDVEQQAHLFNQLLNLPDFSDDVNNSLSSAQPTKAKTSTQASQQALLQQENQRQIASIASHLANQFTQQQFSVDMPSLGRLNIKVDMQENNKQLAFSIETSDNQSKSWLNQNQQSISQSFQAQTGWQASIKVV